MTKPLSILIADDEPDLRHLLQQWLAVDGHTVATAGTGREACALLREKAFDLAIVDMLMPDGDGADFMAEIGKMPSAPRVLAISGGGRHRDGGDYLELAKSVGAHAVMQKPFTWQQLRQAVEAARNAPTAEKA